ncbi:MAG: NUDIX hydrolase [Ignavibacteriales bacterium]|nr:NUDIX hydrolase [Ignavibacteriales bacterium]MCF8369947.1 NUDIX hydrolase [Bacteroidales bacterium]MCF8406088.1 NUDIX hydrolase [Bacteroidales bacterium]
MPYTYDYPRPAVTIDACVFRRNKGVLEVLLIQRKHYPFEGMWALPGGFLDMEETLEEGVHRELEEETNLSGIKLKQLHAFSTPGRDPRGRTVTITFYGEVAFERSAVKGGDDASDAQWFSVGTLPRLAFDHNEMIEMACLRLR